MRKFSLSKLEKLVATAEKKAIKSARVESVARNSKLQVIRKKTEKIVADALPEFDSAALARLQREHDAELRRAADGAKRRTIKRAAEASRRLARIVAAQRVALDALPDDPFGPNSDLLLKVDFIRSWPTPGYLRDSHQAPGVNWAKYSFKSKSAKPKQELGHYSEKVSFYNVWQNPRDTAVLVDVLVRLTALGHVSSSANGIGFPALLWFAGTNEGNAQVNARLSIWSLWTEPAPIEVVDSISLGSCSAEGGVFSDSDSVSIGVTEGEHEGEGVAPALATTGFAVPARASILIEASVAVDYQLEFGAVEVDFESDNLFNVGWAYATVTLPPQMMVSP